MERLHCPQARILIVDDEPANIRLLEQLLSRASLASLTTTTDPREVVPLFLQLQPDLVVLDLHMPFIDGMELLQTLRTLTREDDYLPLLVLTADSTSEAKRRALTLGAHDFLTKPLDAVEVLLRIRNLLQTRALHLQLQSHNRLLEQRVAERTQELEAARIEILNRLALAAEYRDDDTGQHTERVGRMAALLGQQLELPAEQVQRLRRAVPLHDIGKIGIPDRILLKPGRLSSEEFAIMQRHTLIGARILDGSTVPLLQLAGQIALTHHERWDGSGYPARLAGPAIPLPGRIVAVADVFDALTHDRPYKLAWPVEQAVKEIERQSGLQFDPQVVQAFLTLFEQQLLPKAPVSASEQHSSEQQAEC